MPSRLKSLDLQGYKTFANSTVFEFSETVTAIVGPNGSGKSNIADALRWVLGEQSYSLLRGKKTEDMIFSGSEQRSRSGMASATVTFDNGDSWLPIDFSEVAITRRAYRDGQNEYLLNGQRVRLRDVSELLAQSGLAERTYTIIGQGLVDAALSLKAEERRRLFEEAAGIGLHRSRREESLRRLETTERNLERVQDILSELQPRLRSLERQAKRSREYEHVKNDLRESLRIWYGYHWNQAQEELSGAKADVRTQEVALGNARKEAQALEPQLNASRQEIQDLRRNLDNWVRQLQEFQNNRHDVERDLAIIGERQHYLDIQQQDLENQRSRSMDLIEILEKRCDSAYEEVQKKESELEETRKHLKSAEELFDLQRSNLDQIENSLGNIRGAILELSNQKIIYEARLTENLTQLERQRTSREVLLKEIQNVESELQSLGKDADGSEQILNQAVNTTSEIQVRFSILQKTIQKLESVYNQTIGQEEDLKREKDQLGARLEIIELSEQTTTGYARGTRAIMAAAKEKRFGGILGILNQQIHVHPDLEIAITAALGEYLDAVLFEGRGDAESAVALLSDKGIRGALLPLDSLEPSRSMGGIESKDGVIGYAADHVNCSQELRPVVDLLLGQALIVRDREVANRIFREFQQMKSSTGAERNRENESSAHISVDLRVVTLSGEIYYISGPIIAGIEEDNIRLQYSQQKQSISKLLEEKANQIELLEGKRNEQEKELNKAKIEADKINRSLERKRGEVQKLEDVHRQNELAIERARQQLDWRKEQLNKLDEEISDIELTVSEIPDKLTKIEEDYQIAQDKLRSEQESFQGVSIEEYQEAVTHWSTQLTIIEHDATEATNRYHERGEAREVEKRNYEAAILKLKELEEDREGLESQKAESLLRDEGLKEEIEKYHNLINPAEMDLKSKIAEEKRISEEEFKSRQRFNSLDHQNTQARITLERKMESLESLRRRIEDDFGLVDFEYVDEISGPTPLPFKGIVEQLPLVRELSSEVENTIKHWRALLRRIGAVNPEAQREYQDVKERFEFLNEQVEDLEKAQTDIRKVISDLNTKMEEAFQETFGHVADEFHNIFSRLFGGGTARLVLTDPEDLTTTGIDIEARLPGRREQGLSLLSGGERSLTATALVFSLLRVSPTPFCVLDEVDAMLDEANVGRFRDLLRELSESTQFIIITHNRNTVQVAEVMYGVTMSRDSTSQVISLKMDQVEQIVE